MMYKIFMKEMAGFAICVAGCVMNILMMCVGQSLWSSLVNLAAAIICGWLAWVEYRDASKTADLLDMADFMDTRHQLAQDELLHRHTDILAKMPCAEDMCAEVEDDDDDDDESIQDFIDKCNN